MKNKMLSRSDVVEIMAKYSGPNGMPCKWWRSFFKRFGWDWKRIWKAVEDIYNSDGESHPFSEDTTFEWHITLPE